MLEELPKLIFVYCRKYSNVLIKVIFRYDGLILLETV